MTTYKYLLICGLILIIGFFIILTVDRYKYNKKLNSCGNWIPLNMIPQPTRIIHYCNDLKNIRYIRGDILVLDTYEYNEFKMKADLVRKYYIAFSSSEPVELHPAQIDRIETLYKMKIREGE